jgi:hypothetical protein
LLGLSSGCDEQRTEEESDRSASSEARADASLSRRRDAGATSADASSKRDSSSSTAGQCTIPEGCEAADFGVTKLNPCCNESIECGLALEGSAEFRDTLTSALDLPKDQTCIARDRYFLTHAGSEEKRVVDEQGNQYLLTYECDTASMLSWSFIACCMPNKRCGVSTYGLYDTLAVLVPGAPFSQPECVSSAELNAQLKDSKLAGLAHLHDTDKACDYEALAARLTESEPF